MSRKLCQLKSNCDNKTINGLKIPFNSRARNQDYITVVFPGAKFSLFCVNSLLLPMIQSWLREGSRKLGYWDCGANNFKQCCGLCTDLVVALVQKFSGKISKAM